MASPIIVADSFFKKHLTGPGHPECPGRYDAIIDSLSPLQFPLIEPYDAKEADILLCHTKEYFDTVVNDVGECITKKSNTLSTGDVQICPDSLHAALKAAGAVLTAVDAVFSENSRRAFCLVRPPGHHACSNQGMGFCIFNNIAIGARYAQKKYGIEKVLIVDWDVHHGNGTQEIFESDPTVFYFSTHQWPLYPGTGKANETGIGQGKGTTLNCPIQPGENSRLEIIKAFETKLVPAMQLFKPQLVMISAGFDGHYQDPLGGFSLTNEDFAELTRIVKKLADVYSEGRIISVLEGGYNLQAIGKAAKAHVEVL